MDHSRNERRLTDTRLQQLWDLQWKFIDETLRYLFLVNSGGAIAMLGYLGTNSTRIQPLYAGCALILFCVGIVLVGVMWFMLFHRSSSLFESLREDVKACVEQKTTPETVGDRDEERSKTRMREIIVGYVAGACFLLGLVCGIIGFATGQVENARVVPASDDTQTVNEIPPDIGQNAQADNMLYKGQGIGTSENP